MENVVGMSTSSILFWKGQGYIGRPCIPVSGVSSIDEWKYVLVYATGPNVFVSLDSGPSTTSQQISPRILVSSKGNGICYTSGINMTEELLMNHSMTSHTSVLITLFMFLWSVSCVAYITFASY